jgi:hypothetical protein
VRHGCALGLIEILSAAGSCAGCSDGLDADMQRAANADFLGGAAACLLVVLALDRYADFDSQVHDSRTSPARVLNDALTHQPD